MESDGSGLTDGIIRGIQALARFATYRVTPELRSDPANVRDARCFVQSIQVIDVTPPEGCGPEPILVDQDGDGYAETVANLTSESRVLYELEVANRDTHDLDGDLDSFEACGPPGTYALDLDLVGDDLVVLGTTRLTFTIEE
jgi:hypothetical protein